MRAILLTLCSLVLMSCATGVRQVSSLRTAVPPNAAAAGRVSIQERDDDKDEGQAETESPRDAVEFHLLRRTGGAPLSADNLLKAKRHKDAMPLYSLASRRFVAARATGAPRDAALGTWQPLGPGNIGGRTRSLLIRPDDPNTMYAGAVGGGVWKTTDGGATWNPLSDLLPSIGVTALAMDPTAPDTVYAGTGEFYTADNRGDSIRGAGIFKTTDGGATWNLLRATSNIGFYYVHKIVVSPANSQNIYAATWFGVYASADAGATWKLILDQSSDSQPGCDALVIRSDQPTDYLFASCAAIGFPDGAVFRNVDAAGAGKWETVLSPKNMARTSLAIAPSNQSIIYAAASSAENGDYKSGLLAVFRSSGNGDTGSWETRVSNQDSTRLNTLLFSNPRDTFADVCSGGSKDFTNNQGDYDNVIAVDPLNPDSVWVGGIDVFRSDDGGRNWGIAAFWQANPPQLAHADNHVIVFHPNYNGADNQTLFVASDGGVYRTDNALAATATGDRAGCSPYPTAIVWQNINHGYAVTQFYNGAVYPGGGAYLGGAQDNNTVRGSDAAGPNAWTTPIFTGDGGFVAIDPNDPNTWYTSATRTTFVRTADGGATVASGNRGISEPKNNFLFIAPWVMDPSNSKRLYTGGKTLWRTTDGAANWAEASAAIPSADGTISAIVVSPTDANHMLFGTSLGYIFRNDTALTADKTTAWTAIRPRSGFLSHIEYDPMNPNIAYATYSQYKTSASQSHIYRSADGGTTWTGIDGSGATGIPDIPVFTVIADPKSPATLYAGTDIGVFVSLDSGATWARDDNPFADAVTETLVLDRSAGQSTLFAFTHGRGVWKTALPGSGAPCQYSLSTDSLKFSAWGENTTVKVSAGDGCVWSMIPGDDGFFAVSKPAMGKGNGSFTVGPNFYNNGTRKFNSTVFVQDKAISLSQDAAQVASGNDDSSSPFPLGTLPAVVIENTTGATESANDPVHSCSKSADSKTVWFSVTAAAAGTMQILLTDRRVDNGRDAGVTLSAYRIANGTPGPEFACGVIPQSTSASALKGLMWKVSPGDSFLLEVSATTSGAPDGAIAVGGNLTLVAVIAP